MNTSRSALFLILLTGYFIPVFSQADKSVCSGAWKSENGVVIFTGNYFSYALFEESSKKFYGAWGGSWSLHDNTMFQTLEFSTIDPGEVGQTFEKNFKADGNAIFIDDIRFDQIDDGQPGQLEGAWLFSGRMLDGQLTSRDTNQPRKTMKILSGTRFQWIAYNTETGEFFGTGGGNYTSRNGQYIENIDFFSRDSSRVGASLSFDFEIKDGIWHHQGLNSRGEPLYELWSPRK